MTLPIMQCGSCKYWVPFSPEDYDDIEVFGTCSKVEHYTMKHKELANNWLACVVDGSGYFAELKTKESFGCVLWESSQ